LRADTVVLRPVADTSLFELSPDNNLGATPSLPVGDIMKNKRCRLLLKFDVSSQVPPGATVTSASLAVKVLNSKASSTGFRLHRLNVPWAEGTKSANTGSPATAGESTWRRRGPATELWGEPGGQAGVDFVQTETARMVLGGPGAYVFTSTLASVADVQSWVDTPASNQGWIMIGDAEATPGSAKRIAAREDAQQAPTLTIEFTPPQTRPRIDRIVRDGDEVQIHFGLEAGKLYAVEYTEAIVPPSWTFLANAASKFFPTNTVVTNAVSAVSQRFYRIGIVGDID
jgi:hypothetical protein